jgi:hypothetical protein
MPHHAYYDYEYSENEYVFRCRPHTVASELCMIASVANGLGRFPKGSTWLIDEGEGEKGMHKIR